MTKVIQRKGQHLGPWGWSVVFLSYVTLLTCSSNWSWWSSALKPAVFKKNACKKSCRTIADTDAQTMSCSGISVDVTASACWARSIPFHLGAALDHGGVVKYYTLQGTHDLWVMAFSKLCVWKQKTKGQSDQEGQIAYVPLWFHRWCGSNWHEIATFLSWLSLPVWSHVALSKILGASMHHMLPFIFRPLRNTHLKCLLVSFLHFVLVFMNKVPFDTGTEREVVPMLELSGGVYRFRQNMLWISRLFGWTVKMLQCCGGWH